MTTGTTRTGFKYTVDDGVFDNMDVVDGLGDLEEGKVLKIGKVSTLILGKKQYESLKKHLCSISEDGIAHFGAYKEEFNDIMEGIREGKK